MTVYGVLLLFPLVSPYEIVAFCQTIIKSVNLFVGHHTRICTTWFPATLSISSYKSNYSRIESFLRGRNMYVKVDVYFTVSNRPKAFRLAALAYDLPWLQTPMQTMHSTTSMSLYLYLFHVLAWWHCSKKPYSWYIFKSKIFHYVHRVSRIVTDYSCR